MSTHVFAIDPGAVQSGYVVVSDTDSIGAFGKIDNEQLIKYLRRLPGNIDMLVVESTRPRGMPASMQLFDALMWAGRFIEAAYPTPHALVDRSSVKLHITGRSASKDQNVVAALIDRYGGSGGKAAAVGWKATPGPLYGVSRDVWQALALGLTYLDQNGA